jgi:hypothetical protein
MQSLRLLLKRNPREGQSKKWYGTQMNAETTIEFGKEDRDRMNLLAEKARADVLTAEEQVELDCYERVGHFLSLLWSKARVSLKQGKANV